jgi:4,5-dihydroxyphthalate decarboxylase
MSDLLLTYAGRIYDRTQALAGGRVKPEGVTLRYVETGVDSLFWRMARFADFEIAEMSLSTFLLTQEKRTVDLVAIPVFPARAFRHNMIFVNSQAGIEKPADLKGRRIGIPEYQMTAAMWIRGMLESDYGVSAADVTWVRGPHTAGGHGEERVPWLPPHIRIEDAPAGQGIDAMLEEGQIDAIISAAPPRGFSAGSPRVKQLFPNEREVAEDYFRRTGLFPIMHTVVIRGDIYRANRWVALNLFRAFCEAKALAYQNLKEATPRFSLPFLLDELKRERAFFGADPYVYGMVRNRTVVETAMRYSLQQGLSSRLWTVEELWAPETLTEDDPTAATY